jgi:hypothetical protein
MELSNSPKMSKPIIRIAKDLIQKWSRIVWDININYSDIDSENKMYKHIFQRGKRRRVDEEDDDEENLENANESHSGGEENINIHQTEKKEKQSEGKETEIYGHAKIPKKGLFDFTLKPVSNISDVKSEELMKVRYNFFDKKNKGGRKKD